MLELILKDLSRARSGNYLEANRFVVDILKALTPRLADSQSNLKPLAASALAEVASSVPLDSATKVRTEKWCSFSVCPMDLAKTMEQSAQLNYTALFLSFTYGYRHLRHHLNHIVPFLLHCLLYFPPVRVYRIITVALARCGLVQFSRIYAEPLLACVADNRKMMRDAAVSAIEKVTCTGGENLARHLFARLRAL